MGALEIPIHMLFIGELLSISICDGLPPNTMVTNLYGPNECTTFSKAQVVDRASLKRISIGRGLGLTTGLVDPSDDSKLVPRGSIREPLLEDRLVAAGYLGKSPSITAVFIKDIARLFERSAMLALKVVATGSTRPETLQGTISMAARNSSDGGTLRSSWMASASNWAISSTTSRHVWSIVKILTLSPRSQSREQAIRKCSFPFWKSTRCLLSMTWHLLEPSASS